MFVQKTLTLIILMISGGAVHSLETQTDLHELDSVGMMPEIIVTASKYENQDEAWLGMVEAIVVEARRPSDGGNEIITGEVHVGMVGEDHTSHNSGSGTLHFENSVCLLVSLTLILVILSNFFMSLSMYPLAGEEDHNDTKH